MSETEIFTITVPAVFNRQRLDKVLTVLLAGQISALSRARLQGMIKKGLVTYDNKKILDPNRKTKTGEIYKIHVPPPESAIPTAQAMKLEIVYEDDDVIIIDKPSGMVVHPAPGSRDHTLVNALLAHCGDSLSGIGGVARPGIVHRLDKDTTGLIIAAKNDLAHQNLTRQFSDRSMSRIYQALVWGIPAPREGSIEAPIGRHPRDRKKMAVAAKGRVARTHYKVLKVFKDSLGVQGTGKKRNPRVPHFCPLTVSLVECRLATGRTHQIRVHLAYKKHPVVGDITYGRRGIQGKGRLLEALHAFPRQALHAVELKFIHPRTGKAMRFKSPLPKDMATLLSCLDAD